MNRKKKLLYVVHSLTLAGTERLVFKMAMALTAQYEVAICCLDSKGAFWESAQAAGIKLFCLERKPGWHLKIFIDCVKTFKEFNPDIIHAHQYTPYFYSAISKILIHSPAKLIFTEHGRHYPDKVKRMRRAINQLLLKYTDAITAVSEYSRKALYEKEALHSKPITVIYNGIDLTGDENKKDIRAECGIFQKTKIVGFAGNLRPIKNPILLLKAFARICKNEPNLVLVYIGDGELKEEIQNTANSLGVEDKVFLPGARNPAEPYIAQFDIFVLPSLSEATPLTLLEAMEREVPVIATKVGGMPEIIENGKTGYLVPCNDEKAMCEAIMKILENPEESKIMAIEAKKRVTEKFRFEQMLNQYVSLYQSIDKKNLK